MAMVSSDPPPFSYPISSTIGLSVPAIFEASIGPSSSSLSGFGTPFHYGMGSSPIVGSEVSSTTTTITSTSTSIFETFSLWSTLLAPQNVLKIWEVHLEDWGSFKVLTQVKIGHSYQIQQPGTFSGPWSLAQIPLVSMGRRASFHQGLSSKTFLELGKAHQFDLAMVKYGGKAKKLVVVPSPATRLLKVLGSSPQPFSPGTQRTTGHDRGANRALLLSQLRFLSSSTTNSYSLGSSHSLVSDQVGHKIRSRAQILSSGNKRGSYGFSRSQNKPPQFKGGHLSPPYLFASEALLALGGQSMTESLAVEPSSHLVHQQINGQHQGGGWSPFSTVRSSRDLIQQSRIPCLLRFFFVAQQDPTWVHDSPAGPLDCCHMAKGDFIRESLSLFFTQIWRPTSESLSTIRSSPSLIQWPRSFHVVGLLPQSLHLLDGPQPPDLAQGLIQRPLSPDAMFTILSPRRVAIVVFQSYATSSSNSQHKGEGGPPPILVIKTHQPH